MVWMAIPIYQLKETKYRIFRNGNLKGKGMCWAKNKLGHKGSVVVLTGDGEFQEGQIFESLQTTSHQNINNLIVIIDHNKIQSSQYVKYN